MADVPTVGAEEKGKTMGMTGMAAALFGDDIDKAAFENRTTLLAAVMHAITCMVSGAILDIRTAVLVTVEYPGSGGPARTAIVCTGTAFDELGGVDHARSVAEKVNGTFEVIDGREFTAKGAYKAAVRKRMEAEKAALVATPVEPQRLDG